MFRFFPVSIELRQQAFLWADDLSSYDSILSLPFEIPFYGAHVSLFTLLMAISTFLYTKFNNSMTPTSGNSMMQQQMLIIQYVMPFMLLVWFNNYSSGLSYYYFISNVLTFGQQWVIKEFFIDENAMRAKIDETKAKGGSQSRFAKKMNEMLEANKEAGNRRARRSPSTSRQRWRAQGAPSWCPKPFRNAALPKVDALNRVRTGTPPTARGTVHRAP